MEPSHRDLGYPRFFLKSLDLERLATGINQGFILFDRSSRVIQSSDDIRSLEMSKIMIQARDYISAVDTCLQIAQKGYVLADAAISLHEIVCVQFESIDRSQWKAHLDWMAELSSQCLNLALSVKETFGPVCNSLSQISTQIESGVRSGSVNTLPFTPAQTIPSFSNEMGNNVAELVDWWRCVSTALGTLANNRECIDLEMSIISLREQWLLATQGYLRYQLRIGVIKDYYAELANILKDGLYNSTEPSFGIKSSGDTPI